MQKKSDLFYIIWKYAEFLKICIENGQNTTRKTAIKPQPNDQMSS